MKKPNFFILGAPKCGTTSISVWLAQHPQVFMSDPKEPRFFNFDFGRQATTTLAQYEAVFERAQSHHVAVGEASTPYLGSRAAVGGILEYAPDARFVVMLRKPQDMAMSLHAEMCLGIEDEPDFAIAWRLQEERAARQALPGASRAGDFLVYREVCRLGSQMERIRQYVPSERLLALFLEDIRRDAAGQFARLLEFLGVDPFRPKQFSRERSRRRPRSFALKRILRGMHHVKQSLGIRHATGILRALHQWNLSGVSSMPITRDTAAELDAYFLEEILLTERILGRVPDEWKTPSSSLPPACGSGLSPGGGTTLLS